MSNIFDRDLVALVCLKFSVSFLSSFVFIGHTWWGSSRCTQNNGLGLNPCGCEVLGNLPFDLCKKYLTFWVCPITLDAFHSVICMYNNNHKCCEIEL